MEITIIQGYIPAMKKPKHLMLIITWESRPKSKSPKKKKNENVLLRWSAHAILHGSSDSDNKSGGFLNSIWMEARSGQDWLKPAYLRRVPLQGTGIAIQRKVVLSLEYKNKKIVPGPMSLPSLRMPRKSIQFLTCPRFHFSLQAAGSCTTHSRQLHISRIGILATRRKRSDRCLSRDPNWAIKLCLEE